LGEADGKFAFRALRPGTYLAAAWEQGVNPVPLAIDHRLLKLYHQKGKAVAVRPGPSFSVALTLVPSAEVIQARANP
jgi:hypothetical protein